jgi:glycosyltransferase involved in cell wall biosynthesis
MIVGRDITVVIPAYNAEKTIVRAIESICSQTLTPHRVIVVDDNSTDATPDLVRTLQQKHHGLLIECLSNVENLGPGESRNRGWDIVETYWTAFLDSDDAWHPRKLEIQIGILNLHPNIEVLCTETKLGDESNWNQYQVMTSPSLQNLEFRQLLFKNRIPTRSVILKTSITHRFPRGLSEDFKLWLTLSKGGSTIVKINQPLAIHFREEYSAGGISSKIFRHQIFELKAIFSFFRKNPILISIAGMFSVLKFFRRVFIFQLRRLRP